MERVKNFSGNIYNNSFVSQGPADNVSVNVYEWVYRGADYLLSSACLLLLLLVLIYLTARKSRLEMSQLYWLLALFLGACGIVHLLQAFPASEVGAVRKSVRLLAGLAGWTVAIYLIFKRKKLLSAPATKELEAEIRARKEREEALQWKTGKLMEAERIAMLTHAYWDFSTDRIELSEAGYELFGLPPGKEISFDTLLSLILPEDREYVIGRVKAIHETKIFEPFYFRITLPSHGPRHFLAAGRFPFENREVLVCTLQDVTQQRNALQHVQNMRLKEIASIQSHQVRGIVASIMGLSDIFNYENPADPANVQLLKDIRKATQNLDQLIHEIVEKANEPRN
jgi:signal transduction histidine kinase